MDCKHVASKKSLVCGDADGIEAGISSTKKYLIKLQDFKNAADQESVEFS